MSETFRPVVGFEGRYEVSDVGRIRSLLGRSLRILKATPNRRGGYLQVGLHANGRQRSTNVHALVLEAFVGPRPDGNVTRHLDGNPGNNRVENLKWGTQAENGADTVRHGSAPRGEAHPRAKLTEQQAREIFHAKGSCREIGARYGVSKRTVSGIKGKQAWAHLHDSP